MGMSPKVEGIMADNTTIDRTAVRGEGFRWGFVSLSFGLLALVIVRGAIFHDAAWDLLGLVIIGGSVPEVYQRLHGVRPTRRHSTKLVAVAFTAAAVAALLGFFIARFHVGER